MHSVYNSFFSTVTAIQYELRGCVRVRECVSLCVSVCICVSVHTPLFLYVELLNGKSASVQHAVSQETRLVVRLELTYDLVRLLEAWIHQTPPPSPLPPPTVPLSADDCAPILLNPDGLI